MIRRESAQMSPGGGDILGDKEGFVTLLFNYPLPYSPGSWESGSNCRAFRDLPQGMLSDPKLGGPGHPLLESCWLGLWVSQRWQPPGASASTGNQACNRLGHSPQAGIPRLKMIFPRDGKNAVLPGSTGVVGTSSEDSWVQASALSLRSCDLKNNFFVWGLFLHL